MKPWKEYGRYGSVGLEFVLSMVVGYLLGRWADRHLHTHGGLTLLGLVVGIYAGFRSIFEAAKHMQRDLDRADENERRLHQDPAANDSKDDSDSKRPSGQAQ